MYVYVFNYLLHKFFRKVNLANKWNALSERCNLVMVMESFAMATFNHDQNKGHISAIESVNQDYIHHENGNYLKGSGDKEARKEGTLNA